jgi:hypothetical protein
MPNKENLRKWVAALRSGEFKQDRGRLHTVDRETGEVGYCCLGVACEIAERNGVIQPPEDSSLPEWEPAWRTDSLLTRTFMRWLGVDSNNPYLSGTSAASWNDREGASFAKIADLIELQYGLNEDDNEVDSTNPESGREVRSPSFV